MSHTNVKILLIEDNPGDARLIREMLTEVPDVSFELESANRLSTGLRYLAKETPDVILLDIGLPDSQGLDTLKKVYAKIETVPIVVLTGLEDEAVGMEAVQQGAQDYLVKGQIQSKVLWRVVNYSIERKRAGEILRQSEERYRTVLEEMEDGYFETDLAGNFTVVNDATCHVLGCPREKIIGTSYRTFVVKEHVDAVYQAFNQVYRTGTPIRQFSYEVLGEDGVTRFVEVSVLLLRDKEGQIVGFRGIGRDITERKRAEEILRQSEERYRALFNSKLDGMCVIDETMKVLLANQAAADIFGFDSADEVLGTNPFDFIPSEERERVLAIIKKDMFENDLRQINEFRLKDKSGKDIWLSAVGTLTEYQGKLAGLISFRDITEHKKAEEALEKSRELLEKVFSSHMDAIFVLDSGKPPVVIDCNPAAVNLFGYTRNEVLGQTTALLHVSEKSLREFQGIVFPAVEKDGYAYLPEFRMKRKDGTVFPTEHSVVPIMDEQRKRTGWVSVVRDITERKRAEEALAEEATRRRILIEQSSDGIVVVDGNGKVHEVNQRFAEMLGYSLEEARELHIWDWDAQWTREQLLEMLRTDSETGRHIETYHRRKDGTVFDVEISSNGAMVWGQKLAFCVCRDITERKRMERELRSSHDQLDRIINSMVEVLMVIGTDHNIIDVNRSFLQYYGVKREDVVGRRCYEVLYRLSKPCSTAQRRCPLKTVLKTGKPVSGEATRKTAEGQEFIFEETMFPLVDAAGNIEAVVEMQHDVTVRKQMEETIRLSEQNLRSSIENSPLGIRVLDKNGKTLYANRALLDMWGYGSVEELEAVPAKQRYAPGSYDEHAKRAGRMRGENVPADYEVSIVRSDGQIRQVSASARTLIWGGEEQFQVVYQDITERKQAEAEYRSIIRASMDSFWLTDMQGHFLDVNEAYCRLIGYSRDELLNMSIKDVEEIERAEDIKERIRKIEEVGYDHFETRHRRKDGGIVDVEISVNYLSTAGGRMFVFLRDITERKRMEEELRHNLDRFKKAMEGVIQVIASIVEVRDPYTAGHQRRVAEIACAIAKEMGFSEERIEEIRMASLIHDIGKIYVPAEILSKPSRLTEIEFSMIKSHPQVAYDILKSVEFPWPICKVVLQHHERMDSSGYPAGLSGEDITPGARIVAVADVVEAMASHRPYRPALGLDKALEEISKNRGVLYDPEAADACLRVFNERGFRLD
jgi:PAS domain S-box-containing protein